MIAQTRYIITVIVLTLVLACSPQTPKAAADNVNLEVFGEGEKWGYEVYVNNKVFICQNIIPAIPGKIAFKSRKDAELVGNLVADKIRNHEIPKVEVRELTLLGINESL